MIWDARSVGQFSAGEQLEPGEGSFAACGGGTVCPAPSGYNYMLTFQNNGARQGHPRGTLQLQFTRMLDSAKGFAYKPKAEIAAYMSGAVDSAGYALVDGSYRPVGAGAGYQPGDTVYTYCETTFRAMITGIASVVVMGYPTRFYDGAMVEWHSLSYLPDATGTPILPADSPWRTDVKSFFRPGRRQRQRRHAHYHQPLRHAREWQINAEARATRPGSGGDSGGGGDGQCRQSLRLMGFIFLGACVMARDHVRRLTPVLQGDVMRSIEGPARRMSLGCCWAALRLAGQRPERNGGTPAATRPPRPSCSATGRTRLPRRVNHRRPAFWCHRSLAGTAGLRHLPPIAMGRLADQSAQPHRWAGPAVAVAHLRPGQRQRAACAATRRWPSSGH